MDFPDLPKGGGGSSIGKEGFIKLADGASITGVFRGAWVTYKQHYVQGDRGYICMGPDCARCKAGDRPSFRARINFIVRDTTGSYAARVWDCSSPHLQALKDANDSLVAMNPAFKLDEAVMTITRSGQKTNTRYAFKPAAQWQLTPPALAKIEAVPLLNLDPLAEPAKAAPEPGSFDGAIPF